MHDGAGCSVGMYCPTVDYLIRDIRLNVRIRDCGCSEQRRSHKRMLDSAVVWQGGLMEYARVMCGKQITLNLCNLRKSVADRGFLATD